MDTKPSDRPVRVAIFESVPQVADAIRGLFDAGFAKEHVSVVCSDHAERVFEKAGAQPVALPQG
jgi:hypothetical protein